MSAKSAGQASQVFDDAIQLPLSEAALAEIVRRQDQLGLLKDPLTRRVVNRIKRILGR